MCFWCAFAKDQLWQLCWTFKAMFCGSNDDKVWYMPSFYKKTSFLC
jgi:hypothetical protein